MKFISIFSFSLLVLACNVLNAQEQPYSLTLDEAVSYALQHNKSLLNVRDDVTSSTYKIKEARAQGLPQIDGTLDYMTYFNYEMNFSFGGGGDQTTIDYTKLDEGDLEIMKALGSMFGSSEPIIMDDQMSGKIQVSQLIFSGQFWTGLSIAKIAKELSTQNVTRTEQDVKEGVINTYYTVLVTEKNLDILQENINNLISNMKHTNNMYKSGILESTDVDQLQITVNQLKNAQKAAERGLQLSYNMLRYQIGVAPDAKIALSDTFGVMLNKINPAATLDPAYDVTGNIGYSLAESQVKLSEKQLKLQHMAYAPTVAGFYSYTKKFITTGFDLTPNHLAGVTMSMPIFSSGMRHAKVSQAKIDLNKSIRNRDMAKEQLETQRNQLLFNYQSAMENYLTQKANVDVANRVFNNVQNKFNQGMISSLDLTQANGNLLNAERDYLNSILTLLQAQTALDKLYNKI